MFDLTNPPRYFTSCIECAKNSSSSSSSSSSSTTPPQLARENVVGLINAFVLHPYPPPQPHLPEGEERGKPEKATKKVRKKKKKQKMMEEEEGERKEGEEVGERKSLSAVEEIQLLLTLHSKLQELESMEIRYCMFDAILNGTDEEGKVKRGDKSS